jgi:hypothetical protein
MTKVNCEYCDCDNICSVTGRSCEGKCYRFLEKGEDDERD